MNDLLDRERLIIHYRKYILTKIAQIGLRKMYEENARKQSHGCNDSLHETFKDFRVLINETVSSMHVRKPTKNQ